LPKQYKIDAVSEFKEKLEQSEIAIATQYIGINVAQVTELRKSLREAGVEFKVYKNNLVRIALRDLGLEEAADAMEGPTAWAFSSDPVAPAKLLKETARTVKFVSMKGGVLEGKAITADQLQALADLPSRDQLLAMVAGTVAAPIKKLLGALNATPRNLALVVEQVRQKKEEEEGAAA
jgi:large subunit ribosomal protein L10